MQELPTITDLIDHLKRLPSVGGKSAERMAYALLAMDEDELDAFGNCLKSLKSKIHLCPECGLFTEHAMCEICEDTSRNYDQLIVVSYQKDVFAFEKLDQFHGHYHILNGVLSASKGIGYDELNINSLFDRIEKHHIKEIIIATNPTIEGETTALFLAKLLEKYDVVVTRLAYGLPMGGQLDYADTLTLTRALEGRTHLK